jgi:hypothetical protein
MDQVNEKTIKVTSYEVAGKLPDPFTFDDGTRVKTREDWQKRRKEIFKTAVNLQYGNPPPEPEFLEVESLHYGSRLGAFRIKTGTKEKPIVFVMRLFFPTEKMEKYPVIIDGDMCFPYPFDSAYREPMKNSGVLYAVFDRTELAHDEPYKIPCGKREGQIYDTYPGNYGTLAAWAWGYSRCLDALIKLDVVDTSCVAFTGHSRGGKTAMLAGVLDERATIVNPSETNAGSCSCYRIKMTAITEDGEEKRSETGADLVKAFPHWIGDNLAKYMDDPATLPFDAHYLKALVAPRVLLVGEAASDIWTNPIGTWQTTLAATEVFDFLGVKENLVWYFRKGYHFHKPQDIECLIEVIKRQKENKPLGPGYFVTPFEPVPPIFDWKKPEVK